VANEMNTSNDQPCSVQEESVFTDHLLLNADPLALDVCNAPSTARTIFTSAPLLLSLIVKRNDWEIDDIPLIISIPDPQGRRPPFRYARSGCHLYNGHNHFAACLFFADNDGLNSFKVFYDANQQYWNTQLTPYNPLVWKPTLLFFTLLSE